MTPLLFAQLDGTQIVINVDALLCAEAVMASVDRTARPQPATRVLFGHGVSRTLATPFDTFLERIKR